MYKHSITREYEFSYGHKLWNPALPDGTNHAIYGKCCNYHGHNAQVFVTVSGPLEDGMVINFNALDLIVKPIVDSWDHKQLNELPEFKDLVPTAEHMAEILFHKIRSHMTNLKLLLMEVTVYENARSSATYREGYYQCA